MADYGVPEDLDGVLAWSWAQERLVPSRCYWVATAGADGRPHALPVWGVWLDEPDAFWFSCSPSARKVRNLADNPAITVTTEDPRAFVSLEGGAERTGPGPLLDRAVDTYWQKYGGEMGLAEDEVHAFLRENAGYAVTPERAFGLIETAEEFGRRATRWRW